MIVEHSGITKVANNNRIRFHVDVKAQRPDLCARLSVESRLQEVKISHYLDEV